MNYNPPERVLERRVDFAKSFTAFRRVRPRVPFWQLAAHRIPTLWSLYRGLLRNAPGEDIRWRIRMYFERYRSLTSPTATRQKLTQMHKYLDVFRAANNGDERSHRVLQRYSSMIAAKREKVQMHHIIKKELAWQERLRNRPILTGAYLRPTLYNHPLPRMKPQPVAISMMIRKRRLARDRRGEKFEKLRVLQEDIRNEAAFEKNLRKVAWLRPVFDDEEWTSNIAREQATLRRTFGRDTGRMWKPFPRAMLEQIKEARREKIRNKTCEHERERRGELLAPALERGRKRPPPPVLASMTEWQKHTDRVVRGVSEVGYVALVKSRMGRRLKDEKTWKELEEGKPEIKADLDSADEAIRKENEERRRRAEGGIQVAPSVT